MISVGIDAISAFSNRIGVLALERGGASRICSGSRTGATRRAGEQRLRISRSVHVTRNLPAHLRQR